MAESKITGFEMVDVSAVDFSVGAMEKFPTLFKGAVWKTWDRLHNACIKNTFFKNPTYLGISSTVDLGSVYNKSGSILEWDFNKLFSEEERKQIINYGQPQNCTYSEKLTVDFDAFIASEIPNAGVEGELSAAIKSSKDISVKIDNWQIDNLIKNELLALVNASNDPKVKLYKEQLSENNHILVSQVCRINGFSTVINLEKDISASLEAELKNEIIQRIGNTEAKVKFGYASSKQIKVTSQGSFIVFVEFVKTKKMV